MAKGSKFLNPADKARKEARRKELKKNKKQRQQVRSEAIEKRNPEQILAELEALDKEEYEATDGQKQQQQQQQQQATNLDLLFKEKRKRLRALLARILTHYEKEDPEKHGKLKKLEADYEASHKKAEKDYEAIKAAREVKIDDVVLPPELDLPEAQNLNAEITDDHPLMSESIYVTPLTQDLHPPGCPPGPPPSLKLLAEQLEAALCVPPNDLMAPHLQYLNKPPPRFNSSARHKRSQQQQQQQHKRPKYNSSRTNQGEPRGVQASSSSIVEPKKAVIESKPILFLPKATKFVPVSVRSKLKSKPKQIT